MHADARSRVIVTGAGGALGSALVSHYVDRGRKVLALDCDDDMPARLGERPGLDALKVDLTDAGAVDAAFGTIPRSEQIGLLVNAVGLIVNEPVLSVKGAKLRRHDLETWRRVIEANLTAPFVACSVAAERMARSGGGLIVNFSSVIAQGNAGQSAYSAAKAGLEGLTRALAQELGPYGVRVNALAPGFIDVASTRAALATDQIESRIARTALRRLGTAAEIAAAVDAFEANPFLTGVVLPVDGGVRL